MKMKKTPSRLLALLLCTGLMPSTHASAAPFADVPLSHWAYKEIMEAYADGAVQGTSANAYNPNGNVTMAQFIAILTRTLCSEQVEASTAHPRLAAGLLIAPLPDLLPQVWQSVSLPSLNQLHKVFITHLLANTGP